MRAVAGSSRSDEKASGEAAGGCPSRRRAAQPPPPAAPMEALNGAGEALRPPPAHLHPHAEKKRPHRAPSPARPFLKDLHARAAAKPPPAPPKSPALPGRPPPQPPSPQPGAHPPPAGLLSAPGRLSRRPAAPGAKAAPAAAAAAGRAGVKAAPCAKRAPRGPEPAPCGRGGGRQPGGGEAAPSPGKGRKAKRGGAAGGGGHAAAAAALARVGHTDSSSDLSDCPSEPLSDEQRQVPAASSDAESGTGSSDREPPRTVHIPGRGAPLPLPGPRGELTASGAGRAPSRGEQRAAPEELQREVEELRSENEYLKVSALRGAIWGGGLRRDAKGRGGLGAVSGRSVKEVGKGRCNAGATRTAPVLCWSLRWLGATRIPSNAPVVSEPWLSRNCFPQYSPLKYA